MTFFRERSPYFDHPLLTDDRSAAEAQALVAALDLAPGARVLDLGCGFGRHVCALTSLGLDVTGVDPSVAMVAAATSRCPGATVLHGSTGRAQLLAPFDAVICMFTTLGQVDASGWENTAMLREVPTLLGNGGHLLVEVPQRDVVVPAIVESEGFTTPHGSMEITRSFDPATNRLTEHFTRATTDDVERFDLEFRLFSEAELRAELLGAGFASVQVSGSIGGPVLHPDDPTIVAVASLED